ncbi:nucleotidyl transferase AbiEii/AbiGii toxin family protein [Patescibacteria group bacterium]|nr:nucleotidyl transferase AbiEii/AbiGii toxin family protein [Patescibacteria group bacterium]
MHLEILDPKRRKSLSKLGFLKDQNFYMAGGTALALQISHRTSLDFDFYTDKKFDTRKLRERFDIEFEKIQETYIAEDSLELDIGGVKMSFFRYPYGLIKPTLEVEGVFVASKEDIAAMKILAISQRGKRRDFIDIYFLIKEFGLEQIMEFTKEKYPEFNIYVGLQGLVYFQDADEDSDKNRFTMLQEADWKEIKEYIIKEASNFKKFL